MTAQQLKASILQLAIQGKLVPQNPADEPASMLLKRIKAEKDALVKAEKLKKDKHESVIIRGEDGRYLEKKDGKIADITDEIPFDIPESWEWVRLAQAFDVRDGTHDTPKYVTGRGIPLVTSKNLVNGTIDYSTAKLISFEDAQAINMRSAVDDLDILFAMIGTIGNPVLVKKDREFCIKNMALFKGIIKDISSMRFLFFFLEEGQKTMRKMTSSGVQTFVSLSFLRNYLFPLPPLEEQARIVAKIEELLPHIEEYGKAETALSTLNAELPELLKKSILQWAIQGRLVPQDPNDEPASELLKRIHAEKAALIKSGKLKKEKPLPPISEDEIPFDIPDSWEWVRLGSLFHISPRNDVEDDVDVGFMPMPLLQEGFRNSHSFEVRKWRQVKNGFTHFMNGDIVIAKITPCFQNRKSAIISNLPNEFGAGTTELHVLRDETHLLCLRYFLWIFKTHAFIESGVKHFTGTAGQQRIGKDFLSNYIVPLPPLAEQKRIVEKLESILDTLDINKSN